MQPFHPGYPTRFPFCSHWKPFSLWKSVKLKCLQLRGKYKSHAMGSYRGQVSCIEITIAFWRMKSSRGKKSVMGRIHTLLGVRFSVWQHRTFLKLRIIISIEQSNCTWRHPLGDLLHSKYCINKEDETRQHDSSKTRHVFQNRKPLFFIAAYLIVNIAEIWSVFSSIRAPELTIVWAHSSGLDC